VPQAVTPRPLADSNDAVIVVDIPAKRFAAVVGIEARGRRIPQESLVTREELVEELAPELLPTANRCFLATGAITTTL